jgi:hypothetical protein
VTLPRSGSRVRIPSPAPIFTTIQFSRPRYAGSRSYRRAMICLNSDSARSNLSLKSHIASRISRKVAADRESQSPARCVGRLGAVLLPGDAPFAAGAGGCTDLGMTVVRIAPAPAFEETMRSGDLAEDDATGQLAAPINHATPELAYV